MQNNKCEQREIIAFQFIFHCLIALKEGGRGGGGMMFLDLAEIRAELLWKYVSSLFLEKFVERNARLFGSYLFILIFIFQFVENTIIFLASE